jgi:hypothetical protein
VWAGVEAKFSEPIRKKATPALLVTIPAQRQCRTAGVKLLLQRPAQKQLKFLMKTTKINAILSLICRGSEEGR